MRTHRDSRQHNESYVIKKEKHPRLRMLRCAKKERNKIPFVVIFSKNCTKGVFAVLYFI